MLTTATPVAAVPAPSILAGTAEIQLDDITPMNQQILSFGFDGSEQLDSTEMDRRIDETLRAMFDDVDSVTSPCIGYYCTGYWPAGFTAETELPN